MECWTLVRFSLQEVSDGVATRLLRDFMSLGLEDLREIGVFSSEVGFQGKCLYFSPCAAKAFASTLAKLPIERCDPPNPETVLCLYGVPECLPPADMPVECSIATDLPPPAPPSEQLDQLVAERKDDWSSTAVAWSSVQDEITSLLPEIPREEATPHFLIGEDPDAPSKTYRLLRAVLVVSRSCCHHRSRFSLPRMVGRIRRLVTKRGDDAQTARKIPGAPRARISGAKRRIPTHRKPGQSRFFRVPGPSDSNRRPLVQVRNGSVNDCPGFPVQRQSHHQEDPVTQSEAAESPLDIVRSGLRDLAQHRGRPCLAISATIDVLVSGPGGDIRDVLDDDQIRFCVLARLLQLVEIPKGILCRVVTSLHDPVGRGVGIGIVEGNRADGVGSGDHIYQTSWARSAPSGDADPNDSVTRRGRIVARAP